MTATHVALGTTANSYIICCDDKSNPIQRCITNLNSKLNWINHTIEDISALELDVSNNIDVLNNRCFPYNQIEFDYAKISRDDELTCIGFPNGLGALGRFSPFTFRTFASSSLITLLRFDINTPADFFCLEKPSVGGYSGGPVFDLGFRVVGNMFSSNGPTRLLGIMHGTICDVTGGKIAAVSPAFYLKDIL